MEIKIKDANGYIEADWTIEDGVMIVAPKNQEKIDLSHFKDGDVLYCSWSTGNNKSEWIAILKGEAEYMDDTHVFMEDYCSLLLTGDKHLEVEGYSDSAIFVRHATEEEKQELFKALADEGLEWDVKERKLVKVKWKPKVGEQYWAVYFNDEKFMFKPVDMESYDGDIYDAKLDVEPVFKTEAECQEYCDKLNEAINSVKL